MNNEFSLLTDMQQNCKLCGIVEVDQLRSVWQPRKFSIQVPVLIVQSGLLPSIFDWPLMAQLMPAEQDLGELLLQQRINDLELLNSLTTSLQRIQILQEEGLEVEVVMGRPSYNVEVQDDGSILVKELPSLHIRIYGVEARAAAGQDTMMDQIDSMTTGQCKELSSMSERELTDPERLKTKECADHEDEHKDPKELTETQTEPADFSQAYEHSTILTDTEEPTDFYTESEEPIDAKLHRRMSFWIRFGNWLRQSIPRLT